MKRKPYKPYDQRLTVRRMWFNLLDLEQHDFTQIVQGDLTGGVEIATALWLERHVGWWSATLTPISNAGEEAAAMNVRPSRMVSPAELIADIERNFEQFKAVNEGFNADDVHVLVTISNRKPVSVYGGGACQNCVHANQGACCGGVR